MPADAVPLQALPELSRARVQWLGLALGCATGVDFVATSMLATGTLHIRAGIYATPDDFLWCLTAYAGAAIVANLLTRRIADDLSYRGYTLLGLAIAFVGCLLCAASSNVAELSMALAVQGLGAGGLFSASRVLIQLIATPAERPRLLTGFVIGTIGLPALAPWLTATLMLDTGWRMIFLVQALLAALTALFVFCVYPHRARPPRTPDLDDVAGMDWLTVLLIGAGALVLVHGLASLRLYATGDSLRVAAAPLAGLLIVVLAFIRLHRAPDAWLSPRRLNGRRYFTGLAYYSFFACLSGLWTFTVSNVMQLGLGFTFETTGMVLTLSALGGLVAGVAFMLVGARLPGARRYLALGYGMTAAAAWLLATRLSAGLPVSAILPVLLLQSVALPFTLIVVAKLTFMETSLEDFPHAYQFKNILRQVALMAGTGLAGQWLQAGEAVARTHLIGRVTPYGLPVPLDPTALATLSQLIDQQAVLVASANMLAVVAVICLGVAAIAVWQRALR